MKCDDCIIEVIHMFDVLISEIVVRPGNKVMSPVHLRNDHV